MGEYRDDFGEPWDAEVSEMLPMTIHPLEDGDDAKDVIRLAASKDKSLANWLIWGRTKDRCSSTIYAFTRPSKGRVGHDKLAKRIVTCVNAMMGVKDPAKMMAKMRKALDLMYRAETPEEIERAKNAALIARIYLDPLKSDAPAGWWEEG